MDFAVCIRVHFKREAQRQINKQKLHRSGEKKNHTTPIFILFLKSESPSLRQAQHSSVLFDLIRC